MAIFNAEKTAGQVNKLGIPGISARTFQQPRFTPQETQQMQLMQQQLQSQGIGGNPAIPNREKGGGFLGTLQRPGGGISTELSIGVNFDGKETQIPLLVPSLTQSEIDHLLGGGKPTQAIITKAINHARQRFSSRQSPFAQEGEQRNRFGIGNLLSILTQQLSPTNDFQNAISLGQQNQQNPFALFSGLGQNFR